MAQFWNRLKAASSLQLQFGPDPTGVDDREREAAETLEQDPCSIDSLPPGFEDYDGLEAGFAREYLGDAYIQPCQHPRSDHWICCYLLRENKVMFQMRLENSEEFLLSALRMPNGDFYISQYEDFTRREWDPLEGYPPPGWCAVLEGSGNTFKLKMKGCEHCDRLLEKFTCGVSAPHAQLLAEIHHSVKVMPQTGSEVRLLTVNIPPPGGLDPEADEDINDISDISSRSNFVGDEIESSSKSIKSIKSQRRTAELTPRQFWCARTHSDSPRSVRASFLAASDPNKNSKNKNYNKKGSFFSSSGHGEAIRLNNRCPEWNEAAGSLVLKFAGGRVQAASAKNFLMYLQDELHLPPGNAVLQFGKQCSGQFSLDFRYPMSVIQAFAISLSVHSWRCERN